MPSALKHMLAAALLLAAGVGRAAPDLSAAQLADALGKGEIVVVDIRTRDEWRETGVVPGAQRVDFYRGPENLLKAMLEITGGDKSKPVALICRTGNRTAQAQRFLQQQGFTRVYNVAEGMAGSAAGPGWLKRQLPVEPCRC